MLKLDMAEDMLVSPLLDRHEWVCCFPPPPPDFPSLWPLLPPPPFLSLLLLLSLPPPPVAALPPPNPPVGGPDGPPSVSLEWSLLSLRCINFGLSLSFRERFSVSSVSLASELLQLVTFDPDRFFLCSYFLNTSGEAQLPLLILSFGECSLFGTKSSSSSTSVSFSSQIWFNSCGELATDIKGLFTWNGSKLGMFWFEPFHGIPSSRLSTDLAGRSSPGSMSINSSSSSSSMDSSWMRLNFLDPRDWESGVVEGVGWVPGGDTRDWTILVFGRRSCSSFGSLDWILKKTDKASNIL